MYGDARSFPSRLLRDRPSPLSSLLEYLEEIPVEERTRSMLCYIEMAMDEAVIGESVVSWEPLLNVPFSGQQLYRSQEELPSASAIAAGVLDKLESHFSFVIQRLASLTERLQQLPAEEAKWKMMDAE